MSKNAWFCMGSAIYCACAFVYGAVTLALGWEVGLVPLISGAVFFPVCLWSYFTIREMDARKGKRNR